mgnify:CR=1 FL=1
MSDAAEPEGEPEDTPGEATQEQLKAEVLDFIDGYFEDSAAAAQESGWEREEEMARR